MPFSLYIETFPQIPSLTSTPTKPTLVQGNTPRGPLLGPCNPIHSSRREFKFMEINCLLILTAVSLKSYSSPINEQGKSLNHFTYIGRQSITDYCPRIGKQAFLTSLLQASYSLAVLPTALPRDLPLPQDPGVFSGLLCPRAHLHPCTRLTTLSVSVWAFTSHTTLQVLLARDCVIFYV